MSQYKETQLFKPGDTEVGERVIEHHDLPTTSNSENLFQKKNVYKDVKSTVIEGPIKTTRIDKIIKIPKVIFKERKIIPDKVKKGKKIVTKEVEIENIIEVPEIQEKVIYNEIKVPTYVDVPVVHPRQAVYYQQISKNIPKGVELVITQTFEVPRIKPKYVEVPVPIYVPCYIEVPIPAHYIPTDTTKDKDYFTSGVSNDSKFSKRPHLLNSTNAPTQSTNARATTTTINNPSGGVNETCVDGGSKYSVPNSYGSEQKNVEKLAAAGNI